MWHQLQGRKSTGHSSEANIFLFVIVMSGTSFHFSNFLGTVMLNSLIYFSLLSWCRRNNFTRCQWQHLCTWHIENPSCWPHRHKHSGIVPQQVSLTSNSCFLFLTMDQYLTKLYWNYFWNKSMQGLTSNLCMNDPK